jgi:hypothetical protein
VSGPAWPQVGGEVAARLEVLQLIGLHAQYGDRGDTARVAGLFADDGVLENKALGPPARGRAAIEAFLQGFVTDASAAATPFVRHHVSSIVFDAVAPDRIETSSYFLVMTGRGLDHSGRYRDVFAPYQGRWLFAHRRVSLDSPPKWG